MVNQFVSDLVSIGRSELVSDHECVTYEVYYNIDMRENTIISHFHESDEFIVSLVLRLAA